MGAILGEAALAALAGAPVQPAPALHYRRHSYTLPLDNPLFQVARQAGLLSGPLDEAGALTTEASLLRLGDAAIFFMPGEVLPKLGLEYKTALREAGAQQALLVGLANDEIGYILPAGDFVYPENPFEPGAHYEESMSTGIDAGPALTAALTALLAGENQLYSSNKGAV
jgi:hypothetical protein